jgi:putative MATE family efflux protein
MRTSNLQKTSFFGPSKFYGQALSIAIPVMLQQLIQTLISLIDNFMVAGLGDAKMAAVNVANQVNFVYFVILNALCMAGGIYISQFRGAGNEEGMKQAFRFKLFLTVGASIAYFALCQLMPERLMALMTAGNAAQAEITRYGAGYLRLVSVMWVPIAISTTIGTACRETGKTKPPLVISTLATAFCTLLNWILIYGNLGAPRLEVTGAALATNIARLAEFVAFLVYVRVSKPAFRVQPRLMFRIDRRIFGDILKRSWMMVLSETTWVMSETVLTALYNGRGGADVVAGMAAGFAIANLFFLVFSGIHTATGVIIGGTLGSNRLDEARSQARWMRSGALVVGFVMLTAAAASTMIIPVVFANLTESARSVSRGLVFVVACFLPVWTYLNAQFAVARAGGDTAMGVWVDVGITVTVFMPLAFILAWLTSIGPVALFFLVKLTDFSKSAVAGWWLKKERWLRNLTDIA